MRDAIMSAVGRGIVLRQIDRLFGEGTLTGLGDGQLLERYLTRRDEDAFEAIVDLHGPMVLGLCRRMLRDPRDIEDAFQATFLVLVRKAPAIRDRALLSSWLYGVAYRVARRARTRTLRRRGREASVGELEVAAEPEPPGRPESDPMLDQELRRLPEKYRVPLVLCYLRGRTHDQAAEELRCPVGTVRSRLARGRELLRKRLIRRGYAPTVPATLLGGDTTLPARLLVATVPPPLAAATVRAALGFGSSSIFKTGAAAVSSVALAQGVLTTMKLAQFKWIGLAVLATGLSAGGVVASGFASTPVQQAETTSDPAAGPQAQQPAAKGTEERLKAVEEKLDRVLDRLDQRPRTAAKPSTPPARAADPTIGGLEPTPLNTGARSGIASKFASPPSSATPIGALEAQLNMAMLKFRYTDNLSRKNVISKNEVALAGGEVLIIVGQVEGLDQESQDELDRLEVERSRKEAQLEKAKAQERVAASVVSRNEQLNHRRPGMVADTDVAKAVGEHKIACADVSIADTDVREVDLRIRQARRKYARIEEVAKLAERVKREIRQSAPAEKP
jgi:RNA polymerase sigma factor (sigma-70 family)